MKCIDQLPEEFTLSQMYEFENELSIQFPQNKHIKDKIRQQLQIFRDQNTIEFIGRGLQKNRQIAPDSQGVLISNHDTEFTRDIYSFAILKTIEVQRNIAAKGSSRKKVGELLAIYD
ncbi:hypothetical protein ACVWQG_04525 [Neisseria meningitidis]